MCNYLDWEALYLDWFNNFLSSEGFAKYHGIPQSLAIALIEHAKDVYKTENTLHFKT